MFTIIKIQHYYIINIQLDYFNLVLMLSLHFLIIRKKDEASVHEIFKYLLNILCRVHKYNTFIENRFFFHIVGFFFVES